MRILLLDNYDSFTFNLYQYTGEILSDYGKKFVIEVFRNDSITSEKIKEKHYDKIIISPGPGTVSDPAYFGVCKEVITDIGKKIPVLGVCLGMQGMAYYYGGKITKAQHPMHGKTSIVQHDGKGVFQDIPQDITVMRYHSLIVAKSTFPDCFEKTAQSYDTGEIMGLRHKLYPLEGIQFHPESFATDGGKLLLANFLLKGKI